MKKYLPSLLWGSLLGLIFLLLGLVAAILFIGSWNVLFLLWCVLCIFAVFYILWRMKKQKLDMDEAGVVFIQGKAEDQSASGANEEKGNHDEEF